MSVLVLYRGICAKSSTSHSRAVTWLEGAVRSRGQGEDVEKEWREKLKGDREQESRGGEEMLQLVLPFPLACLC